MKKKYFVCYMILLPVICFLLTGCLPENYSKTQERDLINRAKEKMQSYFEENLKGAQITSTEALTSFGEGAYDLTDYVRGTFRFQDEEYAFVVDVKEGSIYTSEPLEEVLALLRDSVMEKLGISATEVDLQNPTIYCLKFKEESGLGGYSFRDVFPVEDSTEDILREILEEESAYEFSGDFQYKGMDIPEELPDMEAPFAALRAFSLYHVFEDSQLVTGEQFSSYIMPCISGEVLNVNYGKDSSTFRRNKIAARDGFRVLYSAYVRQREGEIVTEEELQESDILLTVTEDYIEILSEKELYTFYLFAEEIPEKYVYTRKYRPNLNGPQRFEEGTWRAMEEGNVFAENRYTEVPFAFTELSSSEYRSGNRIYTEEGKNNLQ